MAFEEDRDRLHRILRLLSPSLPDGQWFLNGSAVLILNGIDTGRPMGDLDIFLATRPWFQLREKPDGGFMTVTPEPDDYRERHDPPYLERIVYGLVVNIFFSWRTRHCADIDCNFLTLNAETVEGWPCAPLQMVADWKAQKLRAKDSIDLEAIYRARPDLRPEVAP
jgi:hypothetical protein